MTTQSAIILDVGNDNCLLALPGFVIQGKVTEISYYYYYYSAVSPAGVNCKDPPQILTKLGVFGVPMVLIIHDNF